jgi:hypothetical protein
MLKSHEIIRQLSESSIYRAFEHAYNEATHRFTLVNLI